MPECRDNECECGHLKDMHDKDGVCQWRLCQCDSYSECSAASMFVRKGKRPFSFCITGRGFCPENVTMSDVRVYLQGILAHTDQNNLANFDYPFSKKDDKEKGMNFIFDMLTRVEGN